MIQIFSLTLAANESREVAVSGEYFEIRNALEPIALVELLDRSGSVISSLENPEQSDYVKPGRYETIRITNGPVAQTVRHFYGSGDAGSRRTSGLVTIDGTSNVSVVDGGKLRSESGASFVAGYYASVAAGVASLQLLNPAGSGKNIFIAQIQYSIRITGTGVFISSYATPLATNNPTRVANKKIGGAASVAEYRSSSTVGALGVSFDFTHLNPMVPYTLKFSDPMMLEPGQGLLVQPDATGGELAAVFEFFEEPV